MGYLCMDKIRLDQNFGFEWFSDKGYYVRGYAYANSELLENQRFIDFLEQAIEFKGLKDTLRSLNGVFSIVIAKDEGYVLASDSVRSMPIYYAVSQGSLAISDNARTAASMIKNTDICDVGIEEYRHIGYVLENRTLYSEVYQVEAGTIVELFEGNIRITPYTEYRIDYGRTADDCLKSLEAAFIESTKRLIESAKGRQIVVPLSGGRDSRAIVVFLHKLNYKNVLCFTYGKKTSQEYKISKEVADKLNFRHEFIEYDSSSWGEVFNEDNISTLRYMSNGVSLPHYQDFFAINMLKKTEKISQDAVVVPGHSGDLIGGSHLRGERESYICRNGLYMDAAEIIYAKHYHTPVYSSASHKERISNQLRRLSSRHYAPSEIWNITNRQAKYIINSVRIYEKLGHEYRLPLFDTEITEACLSMPLQFRVDRVLYNEFLDGVFDEFNIKIHSKNRIAVFEHGRVLKKYLPSSVFNNAKIAYVRVRKIFHDDNDFESAGAVLNSSCDRNVKLNYLLADWIIKNNAL